MRRYNHMFQYLFRLRRATLALDDAWFSLRRKSGSGWTTTPGSFTAGHGVKGGGEGGAGNGVFERCRSVRHEMAFLVNNWFTYLQVDVVEAQYRCMIERVEASEGDFSECQRAHRAFLAALTAQSFLDLPSVSNVVEVIMRLAGNLRAIVKSLPGDGFAGDVSVSEETAMEIEAIGAEFARQSAALYTVLKSNRLANDPKAPFLRTLLLRLNFNGVFFDEAAKTSGGAGAEDKTPGGSLAPSVRSSVASMKSLRSGWGEPIPPMPSLTLKR
jgi:gamma-tubulin complex component 4